MLTTNVTVVRDIVACDSRWSIDRTDDDVWAFSIYVDHDLEKCNALVKSTPIPVSLAVANDPDVANAVSSVLSGKANARAPFNSENHVWNPDKLKALDDAIDLIRCM